MFSWLPWGVGAGGAAPPVSAALRDAQDALGAALVSRLRARSPFESDRALGAACGLPADGVETLVQHLGAAVRACGADEQQQQQQQQHLPPRPTAISDGALVLAVHRASVAPLDFAFDIVAAAGGGAGGGGGGASGDGESKGDGDAVPLSQLEALLRDCLRLIPAPPDADDGGLAHALALGAAAAQAERAGGSSILSAAAPPAATARLTREGFLRWAKQGSGVAVAQFLSNLLPRGLCGGGAQEEEQQRAAAAGPASAPSSLWPCPPPSLLGGSVAGAQQQPPPLLLSARAALVLAAHVLVRAAGEAGGRGRARAAAAVEAHLDAAALAAAAAGGGGGAGRGGGGAPRGRAARAVAAGPSPAAVAAAAAAEGGGAGPPATLVLVREAGAGGAVFGGAAFSPWRRAPDFYGEPSDFLFELSPVVRLHHASGINANLQYFGAGFQSLPNGLGMGGQVGAFGLFLDASLERGHSRPNATFACGSLLPSGAQDFGVGAVEVWALMAPEEEEEEEEGEGEARQAGAGPGAGAAASAGAARHSVLDAAAETRNFLAVAGKFGDHSAGVR